MSGLLKKLVDWYSKRTKREKAVLVACVAMVLVFIMDRFVIGSAYGQMRQLDVQIRDEEAAIKKSLRVLLRKKQVQAESIQYSVYSAKPRPAEEEMTSFLKDIETLAGQADVSLLYVKPGASKTETNSRRYLATLECEGGMEEMMRFFFKIESFPGFLKIEKFAIEPKNKEGTIARCGMTVSKTLLS